jgi:hypothetical protein
MWIKLDQITKAVASNIKEGVNEFADGLKEGVREIQVRASELTHRSGQFDAFK